MENKYKCISMIAILLALLAYSTASSIVSTSVTNVSSITDNYTCEAQYCIYHPWYNSSYTFAKNGTTGLIDYASTNFSYVWQSTVNSGATPIRFYNGIYYVDSPISKDTLNNIVEVGSNNKYWSVASTANGQNSVIIRANTSMDTLLRWIGRGSLTGMVIDGNNKVNNTLSFEQTGDAQPRFATLHNMNIMRSNDVAVNLNNSEALDFYESMFSDSAYGWKSTIATSGTLYCYNCYWQNNSIAAMYLNASDNNGSKTYLYGGFIANDDLKPNYNSSIILVGIAQLEAFGFWVDMSNGSNILGVPSGACPTFCPSFSLYGGRYTVGTNTHKGNFEGYFARMQQYGTTAFENAGTGTFINNVTQATTADYFGFIKDSTSIGVNFIGRYSMRDATLASIITNIPISPTSFQGGTVNGSSWFNTTNNILYLKQNNTFMEVVTNFGNLASSPIANKENDQYYNTSKHKPCYWNGTTWNTYGDIQGC